MQMVSRAIRDLVFEYLESLARVYGTPVRFSGLDLIRWVREKKKQEGRYPFDSTILRRLRELREDGFLDYRSVSGNSVYELTRIEIGGDNDEESGNR